MGRLQAISYVLNIPFLLKGFSLRFYDSKLWGLHLLIVFHKLLWIYRVRSETWGRARGLFREGSPSEVWRRLRLLYTRRVIEGPVHSCVWAEAEDPAHFPPALEPGRYAAGAAPLISNGWAASVALPDFWTLCASIKILNYLSNLPFNKFVLKCLDWRKITDGTYNTNQKTTFWNSDFRVLVECGWGRLETQESVYY